MPPHVIKIYAFYHTLWDLITPNKPILVKIRLQKLIGIRSTLKKRENLKSALILILQGGHYLCITLYNICQHQMWLLKFSNLVY